MAVSPKGVKLKYYAAMVDYVLRDMRPCKGPFLTSAGAAKACAALDKTVHEPRQDVAVGDWFAVHGPAFLSMVDGPYADKKRADRERKKNYKEDESLGPGFAAVVDSVVMRHANGNATHIVLRQE